MARCECGKFVVCANFVNRCSCGREYDWDGIEFAGSDFVLADGDDEYEWFPLSLFDTVL